MKTVNHVNYNQRRHYFTRDTFFTAQQLVIEIKNNDYGSLIVVGHSLTDSGVIVDFGLRTPPPLNTVVSVVIKRHTGAINKIPVPMKIITEHPNGDYELVFLN